MKKVIPLVLSLSLWASLPPAAEGQTLRPYRAVMGLESTIGSGKINLEALAKRAEGEGVEILVVSDYYRLALAWGLPPFRNVLRKGREFPSVTTLGVENYSKAVSLAAQRSPGLLLIQGAKVSPYYYWTGNPFRRTLRAHQFRQHLLVLGLRGPNAYENLPLLHGSFSTRFMGQRLWEPLPYVVVALAGVFAMVRKRGAWFLLGLLLFLAGLLFALDRHPFASSPFDPYQGDLGPRPYQTVIDAVRAGRGLALWGPALGEGAVERVGNIRLVTQPRPDFLLGTRGVAAFDVTQGEEGEPGGQWDRHLSGYVRGGLPEPLWAYGGAPSGSGETEGAFSEVETVLLLPSKTEEMVLGAIQRGQMYARRASGRVRLELENFTVEEPRGGGKGSMGEEVEAKGPPLMKVRLRSKEEGTVEVRIIREGLVVRTLRGPLPLEETFQDTYFVEGSRTYYRLDARGPGDARLFSNPIFVRFSKP